jgi:hypothetical protein
MLSAGRNRKRAVRNPAAAIARVNAPIHKRRPGLRVSLAVTRRFLSVSNRV